jgi:hypothetical protein
MAGLFHSKEIDLVLREGQRTLVRINDTVVQAQALLDSVMGLIATIKSDGIHIQIGKPK